MSGSVLRNLIALFEVRLDPASEVSLNASLDRIKHRITGVLGAAALGIGTTTLFHWGEDAAKLSDAEKILASTGKTLAHLRQETRGFFSDLFLATTYNKAHQLHLGDQFEDLAKIASAARLKYGLNQETALRDVLIGVSEGRNARLLHLGAFVDFQKEYDKAAAALGVDKKSFTKEQQVLIAMKALRDILDPMTEKVNQAVPNPEQLAYKHIETGLINLKLAVGELVNKLVVELGPALVKGIDWFLEMTRHENVKQFFRDMGWWVARLADAFFFCTTVAMNFVDIVGAIPGGFHILATILTALTIPAMLMFANVMKSFVLTSIMSLAGTMGPLAGLMGAFGSFGLMGLIPGALGAAAALTTVVLAVDELAASVDPDTIGFFETYVGNWDKFREELDKSPNLDSGFAAWLRFVLDMMSRIVEKIERAVFGTLEWITYAGYLASQPFAAIVENLGLGEGHWFEGSEIIKNLREKFGGERETFWTTWKAQEPAREMQASYERILDVGQNPMNSLFAGGWYTPREPYPMIHSPTFNIDASNQPLTPSEIQMITEDAARNSLNDALAQWGISAVKKGGKGPLR